MKNYSPLTKICLVNVRTCHIFEVESPFFLDETVTLGQTSSSDSPESLSTYSLSYLLDSCPENDLKILILYIDTFDLSIIVNI